MHRCQKIGLYALDSDRIGVHDTYQKWACSCQSASHWCSIDDRSHENTRDILAREGLDIPPRV